MSEFNGCAFNYTGSKSRHMESLYKILPKENSLKVLDLFCGAASLATQLPDTWRITANDRETNLVEIHKQFQYEITCKNTLPQDLVDFVKTYAHSFVGNKNDKEGYQILVNAYNEKPTPLGLYSLLCSSFSNQIRFNSIGEFNLPFGKRYLNPSMEKKLLRYLALLGKKDIEFVNKDFRELDLGKFDLVISDSPYLKTTAHYNENGGWNFKDSVQLLSKLDKYHEQGGKFIVFEETYSKDVPNTLLLEWMTKYNVRQLGDNSGKSNYQRKNGKTQEVLIYNY